MLRPSPNHGTLRLPNDDDDVPIGYEVNETSEQTNLFFSQSMPSNSQLLGGCPFNGRRPLSGMKYPTRESPHRDAASPI